MGIFDFLFGKDDEKKQTPVASAPLPMLTGGGSSILNKPTPAQIAANPSPLPVIAGKQAEMNFSQLRKEGTVEPVRKNMSDIRQQSVTPETAMDFISKNPEIVDQHYAQFGFSGLKKKQDQEKKLAAVQRVLNISLDVSEDPVTGDLVASDNATEFLKNEFYNLRMAEAERSAFGEGVGAFAEDIASTLDFLAADRKGTFNTTNLGKAEMIVDFLKDANPEEAQWLESTKFEGESPLARGIGKTAGVLATAMIPGSIAVKGLRALPVIQGLRGGTTAARLLAISMENVAFELSAQGFINARDKKGMEQFMRDVAASPSVLLPYNRKWQFVAGSFADYLAGRSVGMNNEEALTNAAIGAGAGIMQRFQTNGEVGMGALRRKALEEAEKIHTVVRATNPAPSVVIKMQDDAVKILEKEARLLGFKPQEMSSMFGERRMLKFSDILPGGQNVPDTPKPDLPDNIDDMPLSAFSPQGVADAAAAKKILDAGGTIEESARVSGTPLEEMITPPRATDPSGASLPRESQPALSQSNATRTDTKLDEATLSIDNDPNSIITPVPKHNIEEAQALMNEIFPAKSRDAVSKDIATERRGAKNIVKDIIGNPEKVQMKNDVQSIVVKDNIEKLKDIKNMSTRFTDIYTNTKRVFGDAFPRVKEKLLDPFDVSKKQRVDFLNERKASLKENVTEKFGFKRRSKESAAIQTYGEATDKVSALADLKKQFGDTVAGNIVQADRWFRGQYDELIDSVNAVRKTIYPDKPPIPKLANYYRHFQEISSTVSGIRNAVESPNLIEPGLEGISAFTTPRARFLGFGQKRTGAQTEVDAISGFLGYLDSAAYAMHIDPHINRFRAFRDVLVANTGNTKNVNNYIRFLDEFSNDLAGKTNPFDREVQNIVGRRAMRVADVVSRRVRENTVLGNLSSSVSQFFNIPQSLAVAGPVNSIRGMQLTAGQIFGLGDNAMKKSGFIAERYAKSHYGGFETGFLENGKKMAAWITGVGDEVSTKYIWNTQYARAVNGDMPNPIKFADDETRRLVAGRGIGEVPLIQKSKFFKMIAPFQLEVTNAARLMKDMGVNREYKQLATLLVANFVMNRIAEQVRGSPVVYDPIQGLIDSIKQDNSDESAIERTTKFVGRQAGEIFSNLPLGQNIAGLVTAKDPRLSKELFGEGDPTRFGGNMMARPLASIFRAIVQPTTRNVQDAVIDPIFTYLTPFGGSQLKKSLQGFASSQQGEVKDRAGRQMFEVNDDPMTTLQTILFGRYATKEARDYFDSKQGAGDMQILNFLFGESARAGNTRTGTNTRKTNSRRSTNTRSSGNTR